MSASRRTTSAAAALIRAASVLLVIVVGMLPFAVAPAWAEPTEQDPEPTEQDRGGPGFSLLDMGTVAPLAFYGDQGSAELTFPVPRGLVPEALNATVEIPVNVRSGLLTVRQKERTIARVPLPVKDLSPITIPLSGSAVEDNAVSLTLRTSLVAAEGFCLDPTNPLRLVDGSVSFGGSEAPPSAVADFLPPILRKLTIVIPAAPAKAESESAIRLATAVTAYYGQQPTAVVVSALRGPLRPAGPFERQIIIQQGPNVGVALEPVEGGLPNLRISGPEGELTNQTRLLASGISRLALSSKAVVGPLKSTPQLAGDVTTLQALGQPSVSAVALAPQVSVGLDQTRMGRPAKGVRVHLKGSYTPPPTSISARLVALVGGETVDTWEVDEKARIDRWVDIPDRLLQRYTTLGVALNVAGNTGRCGEFQPLTLTIDGDSVVQSTAADPPVPGGLQSLPQALMPRTLVGIGPDAFADTVRAAAIAVAMQRLSALPLDAAVTSVEEALSSRLPAIIVAADGWERPEVKLPVSTDSGRLNFDGVVDDGQSTTLTLDPALPFGSLQAFVDRGRSLLIATSNAAPAQLDDLVRWMSADPRRWSKLDGVAVVSVPRQDPVVVDAQPATSAALQNDRAGLWWTAGAAIGLVAGAGGWFLWRRRRWVARGDG